MAVFELGSNLVERLLLAAELALASVEILTLAVEVLFLLKKALFDLLRLCPIFAGFLFGGGADLDRFLLGFQQLLLGLRFGLGESLLGFGFDDAGAIAAAALNDQVSRAKAREECHHQCRYEDVDRHVTCTSCIRYVKVRFLRRRHDPVVREWVGSMTGGV